MAKFTFMVLSNPVAGISFGLVKEPDASGRVRYSMDCVRQK
jgi:hypothetical protein